MRANTAVSRRRDAMIIGSLLFLSFVLALSLLRIALAKPLQKTRWFKTNSVKMALWAAAWALTITGISAIFKLKHSAIELLSLAPMLGILFSMFLLTLLEGPAFWWTSIQKFGEFFKKDR